MSQIMNMEVLCQAVAGLEVPEWKYSIGTFKDDAYCIMEENGKWITFSGERGKRNLLREYATEEEACMAFLKFVHLLI